MAELIRKLGLDTRIIKILATAAIAGAVYGGYRILTGTKEKGKTCYESDSPINLQPPKI